MEAIRLRFQGVGVLRELGEWGRRVVESMENRENVRAHCDYGAWLPERRPIVLTGSWHVRQAAAT